MANRSDPARAMIEELFADCEEVTPALSFDRFDLSFLKEQDCEVEPEVLDALLSFFKSALGETGPSRGLPPPPIVVVFDGTWLMDAASWRLLALLKAECKRLVCVVVLRTGPSGEFRLSKSARDAEADLSEDIDFNIVLPPVGREDL